MLKNPSILNKHFHCVIVVVSILDQPCHLPQFDVVLDTLSKDGIVFNRPWRKDCLVPMEDVTFSQLCDSVKLDNLFLTGSNYALMNVLMVVLFAIASEI